ncbi:MAG: DM13 domain-containing protein [Symploca sp. SIO3C6]|nr:DM13 domain-containing protein [Symploca sp. SIO3C6]
MKLNYLAIVGTTTLLTASLLGSNPLNQAWARETFTNSATSVVAQSTNVSKNFVGAAHPTQGKVRLTTENGQRYLEFDENFKTDSGPDLFVLLHRQQTPESYRNSDYVNLGDLEQVSGTQRYAIPDEVNLADWKSVVIWCRQFNVTFGYAPLGT